MADQLEREFDDVDLGDARLDSRASSVLSLWSAAPGASFPKVAVRSADLQGLYGFMENDAVDHRALLAAHAAKTCERIRDWGEATVLIVHDTTTFTFPGEIHRDGLGWVTATKQGFHGHFSLAVSTGESRCPLGVVALSTQTPERPTTKSKRKKRDGKACSQHPDRDTRWLDGVERSSAQLQGVAIPIHVTDRAGDGYEFIGSMIAKNRRFVVRANFDRRVTTADDEFVQTTKLRTVAERAVPVTAREIQLSARRASALPDANKKHGPRIQRSAKLEFAGGSVRIRRTKHLTDPLPPTIDVNFVHVREVDTPAGHEAVDWLLLTSEPIDTKDDLLRVVDHYRARWTVEEFFKAIKTGCDYEHRQLESAHALMIALAVCIPIAWQMLALRHQARHEPKRPASHVIDPVRLAVLIAIGPLCLPPSPTVEDVCYAVAALGGHQKRSGLPGWQTLRAGMDRLLIAEQGWIAREAAAREVTND
jgi:hypothetical protein